MAKIQRFEAKMANFSHFCCLVAAEIKTQKRNKAESRGTGFSLLITPTCDSGCE